MAVREIARVFKISHTAIQKWQKKPIWTEIEIQLKRQKELIFMDDFINETKEKFNQLIYSRGVNRAFSE